VLRGNEIICNQSGGNNAYPCSLHWLVQYGTNGKCPSFFCTDFFVLFVNSSCTLMSIFRSTFSPFSVRTIICDRSGSADAWITIRDAESAEFVVCVLSWSAFSSIAAKRENLQTKLSWRRYYNRTLMYIHQKTKTFQPRMTVTQMTLLTQPAHSGLSIKLSTYCTCDPQVGRGSHWVMTNSGTPHH